MKKPLATTPIVPEKIRVDQPKKVAGGLPALRSSMVQAFSEMKISTCKKTLFHLNQMDGIDCPGCAWPDPDDHRSALGEYCENGVKAIAEEATYKRVKPDFFEEHSVDELSTWSDYELGKSGRLTHPMILRKGSRHYEAISWEEAFQNIASELNDLRSPNEAIFYTSGRTSNEAAFLYQLFVRQFGTNNLPDCSNMCHESSGVALSETLGIGKGSVTLEDLHISDLIIVMGQNPGTNHPRMMTALQNAKRNGAKIISINPLPETGLIRFQHPQEVRGIIGKGTVLTDLFLQVMINRDVSLLKAMMKLLLVEENKHPGKIFDHHFIKQHTHGFDAFIDDIEKQDLSTLVERCGIPLKQIQQAVKMIIKADKIIVCWAMGLTQHKNGVDNIREVVNMLLLKGSVGKPGAGTCPVRGHSNVQGDRTMGIWEKPKPAFLDSLEKNCGFKPPRQHGFDTVEAIRAMAEGKAKVFFAMGGNFLSATPDTEYTATALQNCKMTVQVSTKLNRSHLITGKQALILPCLGRTEVDLQRGTPQFVSVENSMGIVHNSRGQLEPASKHLLSEPAIVAQLAKATLGEKTSIEWDQLITDYDLIRDLIEKVIPGFENYNVRVRNSGGFYLPNCAREGNFKTSTGKANFSVNESSDIDLAKDEFLMMTIRSHDQFNTTIYGLDDRYRGIYNGRRVALLNKVDMANYQLKTGDFIDLSSYFEGKERHAPRFMVVEYEIPQKCIATYFPEANPLISIDNHARRSHTPASKSVVIKIKKTDK